MRQEELRPYQKPPCDIINFQVTQVMINMDFQEEKIEEAIRGKKYNTTMATYLMLSHKVPKGQGRIITVRPFPTTESSLASYSFYLTHSIHPSGQKLKVPATPSACRD